MAIFPIVNGQRNDGKNVIPPRTSASARSHRPREVETHQDLIDFGQHDDAQAKPAKHPEARLTSGSGAIQGMLRETGKHPEEGPLIDFHEDMKRNTPPVKRSDSEGMDDFHDAFE